MRIGRQDGDAVEMYLHGSEFDMLKAGDQVCVALKAGTIHI